MRVRLSILSACLGLALAPCNPPVSAAEVLRVGGTGAATALLQHVGTAFTRRTGIAVEVVPGLGSGGGINAAADRVLDLAVSGRPLTPAEQARGLVSTATLRTPFVFATGHRSPPGPTGRDIVAAYAAERPNWPDGSPLHPVLRPRSDSDGSLLAALFPGMDAALAAARKRPELPVAGTDQDNADMAERPPGSLTAATYTQIAPERRDLRMVPIDGTAPSLAAFEGGTYPYAKVLHVVRPWDADPATERFVQFLRGDEGVRALREAGCLPGAEWATPPCAPPTSVPWSAASACSSPSPWRCPPPPSISRWATGTPRRCSRSSRGSAPATSPGTSSPKSACGAITRYAWRN